MKKRTQHFTIAGAIVAVILLIGFISYKSYSNIGVGDGDNPSVESSKVGQKKVSKNNAKSTKQKKGKNALFLQDTKNPDRVLAINPSGSDGVYQYRRQANGNLYPEYKFYSGSAKIVDNKLIITPYHGQKNMTPYSFEINKNGNYTELSSGKKLTVLNVNSTIENSDNLNSTLSSRPGISKAATIQHNTFVNNSRTNMKKNGITSSTTFSEITSFISNNYSEPSSRTTGNITSSPKIPFIHLNNGDFLIPATNHYLGNNASSFDYGNYSYNYYKNDYNHSQNVSDIMYYRDNESTEVTDNDLSWVKDYNDRAGKPELWSEF